MQEIVPFQFESLPVRIISGDDDEPWFVLADVCRVLEHSNPAVAASRLDDDEKGVSNVYTPGGTQVLTIINESGLYSLILTSRKDSAKRFKKWVTSEVLPAIRKTGSYNAVDPMQALNDPATMRSLLLTYSEKVLALEGTVTNERARADKAAIEAEEAEKALDRIADTTDLFSLTIAAKTINVRRTALVDWMLSNDWMYRSNKELVARQHRVDSGLLEHKCYTVVVSFDTVKTVSHPYVTVKGIKKLGKIVPGATPPDQLDLNLRNV